MKKGEKICFDGDVYKIAEIHIKEFEVSIRKNNNQPAKRVSIYDCILLNERNN